MNMDKTMMAVAAVLLAAGLVTGGVAWAMETRATDRPWPLPAPVDKRPVQVREWLTTEFLVHLCEPHGASAVDHAACTGYLAAVDDLLSTVRRGPAFCYAPTVTLDDLARALVGYVAGHPALLSLPAPTAVLEVLDEQFHCPEVPADASH